jgi:hypothetical protein
MHDISILYMEPKQKSRTQSRLRIAKNIRAIDCILPYTNAAIPSLHIQCLSPEQVLMSMTSSIISVGNAVP